MENGIDKMHCSIYTLGIKIIISRIFDKGEKKQC